jgi:hypothetical protein
VRINKKGGVVQEVSGRFRGFRKFRVVGKISNELRT